MRLIHLRAINDSMELKDQTSKSAPLLAGMRWTLDSCRRPIWSHPCALRNRCLRGDIDKGNGVGFPR